MYFWERWHSKTRLLQCYVVLWIHNIDAICINAYSYKIDHPIFQVVFFHDILSKAREEIPNRILLQKG